MSTQTASLNQLSEDQCWAALRGALVGRLAVRAADALDVFPVNFTVYERAVYIRTAPGSKLVGIANASSVAFEADGTTGDDYWSVVIRGTAERLSRDSDIERSGVLQVATATASAKWNFVRITPTAISGRRFTSPPA